MRAAWKWEDRKNEKTPVRERHGSMRVPFSLVTALATLEFGRQGMPIRGERACATAEVVFQDSRQMWAGRRGSDA